MTFVNGHGGQRDLHGTPFTRMMRAAGRHDAANALQSRFGQRCLKIRRINASVLSAATPAVTRTEAYVCAIQISGRVCEEGKGGHPIRIVFASAFSTLTDSLNSLESRI